MATLEEYIRQSARARGIDPDIAVRVARSEGGVSSPNVRAGYTKNGNREPSWGPFQLLVGGDDTGFPTGLGNDFVRQTGLHPSDPANVYAGIDFALDHAAKNGWGAWYGARGAGIGNHQGIGPDARAVGVGNSAPTVDLPADMPVNALAPADRSPAGANGGLLALNQLLGVSSAQAEPMQEPALNAIAEQASNQAVSPDPLGMASPDGTPVTLANSPAPMSTPAPAEVPMSSPAPGNSIERMLRGVNTQPSFADNAPALGGWAGRQVDTPHPMQGPPMPAGLLDPASRAGNLAGSLAGPEIALDPVTVEANAPPPLGDPTNIDTLGILDQRDLSLAAGIPFVDQTPLPRMGNENLTFLGDNGMLNPAGPVITGAGSADTYTAPQFPSPAQFTTDANGNRVAFSGPPQGPKPNVQTLPETAPRPTPNPKATPKPFDTMGFLGALGGIMAALDQGSPELDPPSLSGVSHRPGQFAGLPMPRGLL